MIEDIFQENKGRYGARRIQLVLERQGTKVNHKRVSKLMSAHGLIAKGTRKTYRKARKGNPYDNAIMEPFYRTLKKNLFRMLIMTTLNKLGRTYLYIENFITIRSGYIPH